MSGIIDINYEAIESDSNEITEVSSLLILEALSPLDTQSTIVANTASQNAYIHSQYLIRMLGNNLEKEVTNIRGIGATFKEYDTMTAQLLDCKSNGHP